MGPLHREEGHNINETLCDIALKPVADCAGDGATQAERDVFSDTGEPRTQRTSPGGTSLHTLQNPFDRMVMPQSGDTDNGRWLITLEGKKYELDKATSYLTDLGEQIKEYSSIFAHNHLFPELNEDALHAKITALSVAYSRNELESRAIKKCEDFKVPDEMWTRDSTELRSAGSLKTLIATRLSANKPTRFNGEKAAAMFSEDQDFKRIFDIATHGARLELPPEFVHTVEPPANRVIQQRMPNVFLSHVHKLWKAGHALFLENDAIKSSSDYTATHNNQAHWQPQPNSVNKEEGRFIIDPSNTEEGFWALNNSGAKTLGEERYGRATYVQIEDYATDWAAYLQRNDYSMQDCMLYKDDMDNAFGQIDLDPDSALLMCIPIGKTHTCIQFTGNFGEQRLPVIFQVGISAPCVRLIRSRISGCMLGYVDDHVGMAHHSVVHQDKAIGQSILRQAICDSIIAPKKDKPPASEEDVIGYHVSMITGLIRPKDAACDKLLVVFLTCDVKKAYPLKFWELAAGLVERYSKVLIGMRSFVTPFHHMKAIIGPRKDHTKHASSSARFCIEMWRIVSTMLYLNRDAVSIPWMQLARSSVQPITALTKSDASPWKLCAGIYSSSGELLAWTVYDLPFAKETRTLHQNHRERLGELLSLILAYKTKPLYGGTVHVCMKWTSDNTSAIKWAVDSKCSSRTGQVANMVIVWFQIVAQIDVMQVAWTPGVTMHEIDDGSRDVHNDKLSPDIFVQTQRAGSSLDKLIRLCDPDSTLQVGEHHTVFKEVHRLMLAIMDETIVAETSPTALAR